METFSTLLALCVENLPDTAEFPLQRPVTRSFYVFLWSTSWINGDLKRHRAHYDVILMCGTEVNLYGVKNRLFIPDKNISIIVS